jgi:hypothetical protein
MAECVKTDKSSSILDWLEHVSPYANSLLNLENNVGGSTTSPPRLCPLLPTCSSATSRTNSPILPPDSRMAYTFLHNETTLSQATEVCPDNGETPASSYTSRSLQAPSSSPDRIPTQPEKLRFFPLEEWDAHNSYEEEVPTCLHYSIEWKVSVNNKMISKNTEQDLVVAPTAYWHMTLKPKLDQLLQRKVAQNRHVRCEDTTVVAAINYRAEPNVTNQFENINIDWSKIEKQFLTWGELFRSGKRLTINVSFNYVDSRPQTGTTKRGTKRGSSATQRMLDERAAQLDAEENSSGEAPVWRDVYNLMQCPGPPCALGTHCWRDPIGKKHYKLRTHHLKSLIDFVVQGNILRSHDDVPEYIREQLVAEEQQRNERQPKQPATAPTPYPPISITNVLPSSHQTSTASSVDSSTYSGAAPTSFHKLDLPGTLDAAVRLYSEWQQSNFDDEAIKIDVQKARDAALAEGLDLEQMYTDQDHEFFVQKGVRRGVARRYIHDIAEWAKRQKQSHRVE